MKKLNILNRLNIFWVLLCIIFSSFANDGTGQTISGTIIDPVTKVPIAFANIIVKETGAGTSNRLRWKF